MALLFRRGMLFGKAGVGRRLGVINSAWQRNMAFTGLPGMEGRDISTSDLLTEFDTLPLCGRRGEGVPEIIQYDDLKTRIRRQWCIWIFPFVLG